MTALLTPRPAVVRLDFVGGDENHRRKALLNVTLDLQLTLDQGADFVQRQLRPLQCRIELLWRRKTLLNLQQPRLDRILRNILGAEPLHVPKAERLSDQGIENEPAVVGFALARRPGEKADFRHLADLANRQDLAVDQSRNPVNRRG